MAERQFNHLASGSDPFERIDDVSVYARQVSDWLSKAREIALEKVNSTHDTEAPRFDAKRSLVEFEVGDYYY